MSPVPSPSVTAQGWHGLAIGAVLAVVLVVGGCAVLGDDPKRTFSLPNDTGVPHIVSRCPASERCRSPDNGELVKPGESFDFDVYFDESRTYVVGDAQGRHSAASGCTSPTAPAATRSRSRTWHRAREAPRRPSNSKRLRRKLDCRHRTSSVSGSRGFPQKCEGENVGKCSGMSLGRPVYELSSRDQ